MGGGEGDTGPPTSTGSVSLLGVDAGSPKWIGLDSLPSCPTGFPALTHLYVPWPLAPPAKPSYSSTPGMPPPSSLSSGPAAPSFPAASPHFAFPGQFSKPWGLYFGPDCKEFFFICWAHSAACKPSTCLNIVDGQPGVRCALLTVQGLNKWVVGLPAKTLPWGDRLCLFVPISSSVDMGMW